MNAESVSLITALRANDGLIVALALCVGPPLVLALIGMIMHRSGASLRPIAFVGALMLPIVITFLVGQLVSARMPAAVAPATTLALKDGKFVDREKLFGPGIPVELIRDAKSSMPGILDEAEVAEVGMTMSGETVLIAQFANEDQAKRAAAAYHRGFRLTNTSGDEESGWRATRIQGDFIEMLRTSRQLFVWSGLTREAASARRVASNLDTQFPSIKLVARAPLFPAFQPLAKLFAPMAMKLAGIGLLVCIYGFAFFKGIGWAGGVKAVAGIPIVPGDDLIARLMAMSNFDAPFTISKGAAPNELFADWRYAEAKWTDLARAHGMRKTFRIRLMLDETAHTVRATDYTAEFDWSAGRSSASLSWRAEKGVMFFQQDQQTVFGLQLDARGQLKPVTSYSYKFDLNEMKSPIIATITQSGWAWCPSAW